MTLSGIVWQTVWENEQNRHVTATLQTQEMQHAHS